MKKMKKIQFILIFGLILSCSEYQKTLNSDVIADKFLLGTTLYDEGKYQKANRLFTQIVPQYRGRPQAQKLMYMHAKCFYETKSYYTANYQCERFASTYPDSEKVQEIAFLGAKSYYHIAPIFSKDSKETLTAIEKLQAFINTFPESEYIAEANELIFDLDFRLEMKAYDTALQYNTLSDYQASIKSFDNFILDFPGSRLREKAMYYRFDSSYKLAINSVSWRMQERIDKAISYFNSFKRSYESSEFIEEAEIKLNELKELKTT